MMRVILSSIFISQIKIDNIAANTTQHHKNKNTNPKVLLNPHFLGFDNATSINAAVNMSAMLFIVSIFMFLFSLLCSLTTDSCL